MGIYSSGNKYKQKAKGYEAQARILQDYQKDIDFGRNLLSNIRQQRIATAQINAYNYSDDWTSSSVAGAQANINSAFAGELGYAYETSDRAQRIADYQALAKEYYDKYAKQQKTRGISYAVTGAVAGALTGGLAFGGLGAIATGATVGQGVGQAASGNWEQGLQNIGRGLVSMGISSAISNLGNASLGARLSGGNLIGTVNGQRLYDLTGTASSGGSVYFSNGSYL